MESLDNSVEKLTSEGEEKEKALYLGKKTYGVEDFLL